MVDYNALLPFDKPRKGQIEAVKFAIEQFESGKKFVIIEGPTGCGKSGIGMAVANYYNTSFYITIQKLLQSQIINDYGSQGMVELKGRNAYSCNIFPTHGDYLVERGFLKENQLSNMLQKEMNCDTGYCRKYTGKPRCRYCFIPDEERDNLTYNRWVKNFGLNETTCPYYIQVDLAQKSKKVLMNFHSFLFQTTMTDRFLPRDLLIVDECHHIEPQLMDFCAISIDDSEIRQIEDQLELPDFEDSYAAYAAWFVDNDISSKARIRANLAKNANDPANEDKYIRLAIKIDRFLLSVAEYNIEWVSEYIPVNDKNSVPKLHLKPLFIKSFSGNLLFDYGHKCLLMSATILDPNVFCKSVGISPDDVAFYKMRSHFPVANRPIYYTPRYKATGGAYKMNNEWGDSLVSACDEIITKHGNDKGIIHTHNFAIAELLKEKSIHSARFTYQRDFSDKDTMLEHHAVTDGSIIIAPAMHEGLDLRNDLSRFQIIPKIPYPNKFDDKQLYKRSEIDPRFYTWLVAVKIVQSVGRSVRSESDWASTYILDSSYSWFHRQSESMLPDWFIESLIVED